MDELTWVLERKAKKETAQTLETSEGKEREIDKGQNYGKERKTKKLNT